MSKKIGKTHQKCLNSIKSLDFPWGKTVVVLVIVAICIAIRCAQGELIITIIK